MITTATVQQLPDLWKRAPRRWGHKWHSMCSYMAMFPPAVPHVFIRWLTSPGDTVYDPFCGRGTTVLEACALGRVGLGSDANPLAWVISAAKADPPSMSEVKDRLVDLRENLGNGEVGREAPAIRAVFHPHVLSQLLWLRSELSIMSKVDRYLYAALLGILHANARTDGTPRGLTIAMPNTFSMAPGYVMNYKRKHGLVPPKRNVLDVLEQRIETLGGRPAGFVPGRAWRRDVTHPRSTLPNAARPKLIFTSPPYLGVMKYGKLNWLRLWLLGYDPKEVDAKLFASGSLGAYLDFMSRALAKMSGVLADDGRICLVLGDVQRETQNINLAEAVAESCVGGTNLRVDALVQDELPLRHKVSRIWKERRGQATKTDRILILGKGKHSRLPRLPVFEWAAPV